MGPVTNLKIGDFNYDGLPDIYVASDSMTKKRNSYLLEGLDSGNFKVVAKLTPRFTPRLQLCESRLSSFGPGWLLVKAQSGSQGIAAIERFSSPTLSYTSS